jgi:hypothetical protein
MKLNLLIALSFGIMASASGVIQVQAANYFFNVNFDTKEVIDFDDYTQTFTGDTYNLDSNITFDFGGVYRFDSCPTSFVLNMEYRVLYRINGVAPEFSLGTANLPDFPCTTVNTRYDARVSVPLNQTILDLIVDDDANFVRFFGNMRFNYQAALLGRTITLEDYNYYFEVSYNFNTTYLFNYFLTDQKFHLRSSPFSAPPLIKQRLGYVFTTAGNDRYQINNTSGTSIGNTRKKYAVDFNEEFFRGNSVGALFVTDIQGDSSFTWSATVNAQYINQYDWYFLNVSNLAQAIVDAPVFDFEEEDCGSFLALNVGCFINNAFAYITNDAPIVSDAFTLLNAGIEMAAQTFGIIGEFADDNVFGVLILAGFGFIAVKWFLKND